MEKQFVFDDDEEDWNNDEDEGDDEDWEGDEEGGEE